MAPWDFHDTQDEPLPRTYRITRTLLQMEEKKVVDEVVEHLMSLIKGLLQESTEEQFGEAPLTEGKALADEEMLEEQIYEESCQEDPDEVSHAEDLDETLVSIFPLEEDVQALQRSNQLQ
jgi:hypothetical protein